MNTPDVTTVQKLVAGGYAVLGAILALLEAFGLDLTTEQVAAVLGLYTALGAFYVIADAVIRHGRSKIAAEREARRIP